MKRRLLGLMQLFAVIGVVAGTIYGAQTMRALEPAPLEIVAQPIPQTVRTHTVATGPEQLFLDLSGTVETVADVSLSPRVSGVIEWVAPSLGAGTSFKAGAPLFRIAREDLEIERRRRAADLAAARAALDVEVAQAENARREWDGFGRGEISDLAARGPQVRGAEAQVMSAEAALDAAELNLARTAYALPFDGRIVDLALAPGQQVNAGQSYGTAYSFDSLEVRVLLSDAQRAMLGLRVGTRVSLSLPFADASMLGEVLRLSADVDRSSRLTTAFITPDPVLPQVLALRPGTVVQVQLQGPVIEQAARIPNSAVQADAQVWLVRQDRLQRANDVRIIQRGRETTLVTGLRDGDQIVVGPLSNPKAGALVAVKDSNSTRRPREYAYQIRPEKTE